MVIWKNVKRIETEKVIIKGEKFIKYSLYDKNGKYLNDDRWHNSYSSFGDKYIRYSDYVSAKIANLLMYSGPLIAFGMGIYNSVAEKYGMIPLSQNWPFGACIATGIASGVAGESHYENKHGENSDGGIGVGILIGGYSSFFGFLTYHVGKAVGPTLEQIISR